MALGPTHAKTILKRLSEIYSGQQEEVQAVLAQRLGDLVRVTAYDACDLTSDVFEYFFKHVDELSQSNSQLINNSLSDSFRKLLEFASPQQYQPCLAFVQQMQLSTSTLQRALCSQMIPILYGALPLPEQSLKQALGQLFGLLLSDSDSSVRAQAAIQLRKFVEQAGEPDRYVYSPSYLFVCYDRLVQDLSDIVRANNCLNGVAILRFLLQIQKPELEKEVKETLPTLIKNISRGSADRYWRVRRATADQMPAFFQLIHRKLDVQDCAAMFRLLCEDCEADIRASSIRNASLILQYLDSATASNVFGPALVQRTDQKEEPKVKVALAGSLEAIRAAASCLEADAKGIVCKNAEQCLRTLCADVDLEVRQQAVLELGKFQDEAVFQELAHAILTRQGEKWLVKAALVESCWEHVKRMRAPGLVEELLPLLTDEAFEVRAATSRLIVNAALEFGLQALAEVVQRVVKVAKANTSSYQNRIACCVCLSGLLKAVKSPGQKEGWDALPAIIAVLSAYAGDSCAFVRQQVALGVRQFLLYAADENGVGKEVRVGLAAILEKMQTDASKEIADAAEELQGILEAFE